MGTGFDSEVRYEMSLSPDEAASEHRKLLNRQGKKLEVTILTGCLRLGVKTWLVGEVVLYEILGADVARLPDAESGFELLQPKRKRKR